MRNLLFMALVAALMAACKPAPEEATRYNDQLVAEQKAVEAKIHELEEALKDTSIHAAEAEYAELNSQLETSINNVKAMPPFHEDAKYKTAVLDFLLECHTLSHHEYQEYLTLLHKGKDALTPDELKQMNRLRLMINDKSAIANKHFSDAQGKFSKEYGVAIK